MPELNTARDKVRVGSEEHAARGAHELSAFSYQVDCFAEGAQVVKHSHPFSIANRFHEKRIRQIGAATEAQKVPSTTVLSKAAQQEPAMTTFVDHRNAPLDGQFRNQLQTNIFRRSVGISDPFAAMSAVPHDARQRPTCTAVSGRVLVPRLQMSILESPVDTLHSVVFVFSVDEGF